MIGFSATRSSINIRANLRTQCDMVEDLLVAHTLPGMWHGEDTECEILKKEDTEEQNLCPNLLLLGMYTTWREYGLISICVLV